MKTILASRVLDMNSLLSIAFTQQAFWKTGIMSPSSAQGFRLLFQTRKKGEIRCFPTVGFLNPLAVLLKVRGLGWHFK